MNCRITEPLTSLDRLFIGIGNGMVGLTCFLVTGQYFKKRKALAVGIVASGSGVGTIVLPYIMRGLYDNFDYTGATLLYGMCNTNVKI